MGQTRGELRRSLMYVLKDGVVLSAASAGGTDSLGRGTTVITADYSGPLTNIDTEGNPLEAEGWLVAMEGNNRGDWRAVRLIMNTDTGVTGATGVGAGTVVSTRTIVLEEPFRQGVAGGEEFELHRRWSPVEKNNALNIALAGVYPLQAKRGLYRISLQEGLYSYPLPSAVGEIEGVTVRGVEGRQNACLRKGRDYRWDSGMQQIILRRQFSALAWGDVGEMQGWLEVSYRRPLDPLMTDTDSTEVAVGLILDGALKVVG